MSDSKKIVYSIIKFLKDELNTLSPEACESIEVAVQCLENAYEIHSDDPSLDTGTSLAKLFADQTTIAAKTVKVATPEEKEKAEQLKTEGNNLVKEEKFEEAINCYTKAIQLDPCNPVYYCNRAAAYSRLNNHHATIEDCKEALRIEPTYSKAHGRLGFAYTNLNMFQEAKECYQKALELEPGNHTYLNNLELNEQMRNISESATNVNNAPTATNLENVDFNAFLRNPSFVSMATQMMADPTLQNMMSELVAENMGNSSGMETLLQIGQRLALYMQNTNPNLIDQLRQQIHSATANGQTPQAQNKKTN